MTPRVNPSSLASLAAVLVAGVAAAAQRAPSPAKPAPPPAAAKVDFNRDIRPVLSAKCFPCHGPDEETRAAGLRLDLRDAALQDRAGRRALVPGNPAASRLYARVVEKEPARRMPPPKSGHVVTPEEAERLRLWIAQGAPYAQHWAFVAPKRPTVPQIQNPKSKIQNPIDAFVLARLERAGLKPSPEADRYTLIRRVSLDLTGLPPTPAEVQVFVNDKRPDAYERLVDRLLASPHYGERWARMWLDLSRYADSAGYGSDPLRMNIWPYRDWVISAFNRNLPYDRFTLEQLAGDLLPNPTQDQILATAFHRNTMTNTEGGTDDEEFRTAAVKDRVSTTMQVWMGLTMGCAQCHTHKYDPISQREYYSFYAYFNQTEDSDRGDEAPTMPLPTASQKERQAALQAEVEALENRIETGTPEFARELAEWERVQSRPVEWTPLQTVEALSAGKAALVPQADGSLLAGGVAPAADTYRLKLRGALPRITALRLEALPHDSLPGKGPGRSEGGNLVLTDFRATALPSEAKPLRARYVRVEIPGPQRILSLAEVQVFSGGENVARKGQAKQSSTAFEGPAKYAIDGNTDGHFPLMSTTHTATEDNPWWEVDLGAEVAVEAVAVWNRTDGGTGARLKDWTVTALSADRQPVWQSRVAESPNPSVRLTPSGERPLPLGNATATHHQKDFGVEAALDADPKTGWALGGGLGRAQAAVFELAAPLDGEGATLALTLAQEYGGGHTLGRFRVLATSAPLPVREVPHHVREILAVPGEKRSAPQRELLAEYFRPLAPSLRPLYAQVAAKRKEMAEVKPVDVPVMRELPAEKRRATRLLVKGNFLTPGDEVKPAVPSAFHPLPADAPQNRLGVAKWLVSPENPLTARVAVNRFWSQLFGTGLVESEEDFGTQGQLPSHPELLDWLASRFVSGEARGERRAGGAPGLSPLSSPLSTEAKRWDMKALLRLIVTSATYRQSSAARPELLERDPRDRLLARYPRRRLEAEGVRDQALALSGLLSRKIGGPSVYPPQPEGLWQAAFNGQRTWPTSTGEDRYRRGLYTFWRRTVPYPSMATFDAPSREICTLRRRPTNTPLQALVTLNDPAYVEMAQALGRRLVREGGSTPAERARYGLQLALARPPSEAQVRALTELYEAELAHFRTQEEAAKKLAVEPLGPLPEGLTAAEAAAWTVVGNVLLNLDGVLTKG